MKKERGKKEFREDFLLRIWAKFAKISPCENLYP